MPNIPENAARGFFLPTTITYDVETKDISVDDKDFRSFLATLRNSINEISIAINKKENGNIDTIETLSGKYVSANPNATPVGGQSVQERSVFRKALILNTPTGLVNGDNTMAHTIYETRQGATFVSISGVANDTTGNRYRPLPYTDAATGNHIGLYVDRDNVHIYCNGARPSIRFVYIVLEYIKY